MAVKKPQSSYKNVMLIDDSEIDNFINQKMIEGCNFAGNVYVHTSSKSALEFLKNFDRTGVFPKELSPEVIFLDINMPIMDGFQFVDEFQKLGKELRDTIKIVFLTTSLNPQDQEKALKTPGVLKYINKPLTRDHLNGIAK
jgi:CheY-like chemotaxis protein